jgi:radical SAM protein with 4Fe4S-binding SPASM domain
MKTKEPHMDLAKACSLHDWLEISEDGKVYPCRSMDLMIGDIRKNTLKTIWERLPCSETGELISKLYSREHIRGKCSQCQFFDICGGCRARALAFTGDMFAADPACPYIPLQYAPGYNRASKMC